MTKEQMAFIQILSDHLNKRKTTIPYDLDWDVMLAYARTHQVAGIVYAQVKAFMPSDYADCFHKDMIMTCCYHSNRETVLSDINRKLNENNIPFFLIKGPLVAECYPIPALRVMSDIDLVVHPEDREACHQLFVNMGYYFDNIQRDREWQYFKNNLEIELHDRMVYAESINEKGQEIFFNDCWSYVKDGQLDWNFHLLFLIFHLRKHLMNSGAGFRQFMDLVAVISNITVDWEWLETKLNVTGMRVFAGKCFSFLNRWFGLQTPLADVVNDSFFEEATQKIFADGIFGFDNEDNNNSELINRLRKSRIPALGMIRIAFSRVFPSYSELENTEPYTYLKKNCLLLPVAWIHRMIRGNKKKKGKNMMDSIRQSFTTGDNIEKRKEMLRKWGLK